VSVSTVCFCITVGNIGKIGNSFLVVSTRSVSSGHISNIGGSYVLVSGDSSNLDFCLFGIHLVF